MTQPVPPETSDVVSRDMNTEKRKKFGTRFLTDPQNVFQHNAWDNVVWDEEQETMAQEITEKHVKCLIPEESREKYENEADQFWDKFYGQHQNRFFKDRHWLFTEFPELYGQKKESDSCGGASCASAREWNETEKKSSKQEEVSQDGVVSGAETAETMNANACAVTSNGSQKSDNQGIEQSLGGMKLNNTNSFHMLEVGCGVGNTVFPVLQTNNNPNLMVYCCDFSNTAIDIVKNHPDYDCNRCHAFVHDVTDETASVPFPPQSLDVIIMIFVLSAVNPDKMQDAVVRLASYLKPGGILLFRDYGRYDLAQLRFKEGRCLSQNFYVRGDGTRVYFFTQEELREMFTKAGLEEKENLVDRRLQVNRGRQLKMYRVWIQCKYVKPLSIDSVKDAS